MSEKNQEYTNLATQLCEQKRSSFMVGMREYIASIVWVKVQPSQKILCALQATADQTKNIIDEIPENTNASEQKWENPQK